MRPSSRARRILLALAVVVILLGVWIGVSILTLPSVAPLAKPGVSMTITVKDWNRKGHPFVVGPRNPRWTPYGAIPSALKKAVVASEDANFYSHEGVDYEAIREAIKADWRKGKFVRGGSTITQQLAKNLFLTRERTLVRKVKEIVLARRMDDALSKSRILELYLNVVELGPMVYGIGHAAHYYFGKRPSALTVRECAFLASMLPGPKVYNPYRKMDRVMKRSERILRRMVAARMISREEYDAAISEAPNLAGIARKVEKTLEAPPPEEKAPEEAPGGGGPVIIEEPPRGVAGGAPFRGRSRQMKYITLLRRRCVASSSSRTRSARVDLEKTAAAAADASSTSRETAGEASSFSALPAPFCRPRPAIGPSNTSTISEDRIESGRRARRYPPPTPRRLESIPAFFSSRRISSRNFFGIPFFSARSRIWNVVRSGKRAA